jgi:hypothetical protein
MCNQLLQGPITNKSNSRATYSEIFRFLLG